MSNSNFYFETLGTTEGEMTDDVISNRIAECNMVIGQLQNSSVWRVVLNDAKQMINKLDESWQDFPPESPQLKEARIIKMASKHIADLPSKYAQEMEMLREELKKRQNPDEIIQKDSDNE
jgi:hypothetical protein